jgi:hypothetical protein
MSRLYRPWVSPELLVTKPILQKCITMKHCILLCLLFSAIIEADETDEPSPGYLDVIEHFSEGQFCRTERLFWNQKLRLVSMVWKDETGFPLKAITYEFDDDGHMIDETVYQNSQFETYWSTLWDTARKNFANFCASLKKFRKQISYADYTQESRDYITHQLFSAGFLQLAGHYHSDPESSCVNPGAEISDKVRITLINGILNVREDLEECARQLSQAHANNTVHYIFRPTEGWSIDLLKSLQSKIGFVSPQARMLANKWKELIAEMGGVDSGGIIIHYAHSIGATDTYVAKDLLTPEELLMIHVTTLGSPTMIPDNSGFGSVVNYVSRRDLVCLFDPIGYFSGLFSNESNVHFLGSHWGIPFIDHTLYQETYRSIIQQLGEQFCNNTKECKISSL